MLVRLLCIISLSLGAFVNQETGWSFDQSTLQAFYIFDSIEIDGNIVVGDGASAQDCDESYCCQNPYSCDVLGAFFSDTCIGWIYADSAGYTTVPAMGYDGGEYSVNYPGDSDVVEFRLYDASEDRVLHFDEMTCTDSNGGNSGLCEWSNFGIFMGGSFLLDNNTLPTDYSLLSAYPNPFNPSLNIDFFIQYSGNVSLQVYDVAGKLVEELLSNEFKAFGSHVIMWSPNNLTSGKYIVRLSVNGNQIATQKVAYIK